MLNSGKTSFLAACIIAAPLWAANPIFTHKYTADPNPIVWKDRIYVYASQDDNNPADKGYDIIKGTPMGESKPTKPGVYIEKRNGIIRKIAVR